MTMLSTDPVVRELIDALPDVVAQADSLETLVRPLLELLETVTGLESTYLTTIDIEAGYQRILFARNTRRMKVPEGLSVPWEDTLCKRALEDGSTYVSDVPERWGNVDAARELGIATYASTPVHTGDGHLYGTLCAASDERRPGVPGAMHVMEMFSKLIAQQVEREQTVQSLRQANDELSVSAHTDQVTRLPNRRALLESMERRLAATATDGGRVLVAFIDLDGFKGINDRYGHAIGDRFLIAIGQRLQGVLRGLDLVARQGGDEFVVLSSAAADAAPAMAEALSARLLAATCGSFALGELTIDYDGPSIGVIVAEPGASDAEALLERADAAMYQVKRQRKERLQH
ncbi:sensor domain-containing diguanylate cyclase [Dyella sp. A6]|uniref:sensor domain-containing diguanylate cyclase n=1 Tax=Dyella aluminiiresistens TaxID=3069105 RepID=UPI002E767F18|nr:sensor domain-containing diguanylate cyclase [Dyella sp. A6]